MCSKLDMIVNLLPGEHTDNLVVLAGLQAMLTPHDRQQGVSNTREGLVFSARSVAQANDSV